MNSILLKDGRIIDGTGSPWFRGDIALENGEIAAVGQSLDFQADRTVELDGEVIAPGFIDIHSHSDLPLLADGRAESKVRQGVTTEVIGNCGSSPAPIYESGRQELAGEMAERFGLELSWSAYDEFLEELEKQKTGVNKVSLVGHGAIRRAVMGDEDRRPDDGELEEMKEILAGALQSGAAGFSSGLIYPPSAYAGTDELIELARTAARAGGYYATHMRHEGENLLKGIKEAIAVGREAEIPVQISHHKVADRQSWGLSEKSLALIEKARREGVDITFDVYPYLATSTGLSALLPDWAHEGGREKMKDRLENDDERKKIASYLREKGARRGWDNIYIASTNIDKFSDLTGRNLQEAGEMMELKPARAVMEILRQETARVGMIGFAMCEEDLHRIISHRCAMVGSDGSALAASGVLRRGKPHPRSFGTFPRVAGPFVRDEKLFPLEEAVFKMTGFPAWRLGLSRRGLIREGLAADLVVFSPDEIEDRADFDDPHRYPAGIKMVIVNGEIVVEEGHHTGKRPGQLLRSC